MKAVLGLASAAILSAGVTFAQPPAARAPAPAKDRVVEGVTVVGKRPAPTTSCSSRDDACIATVVAELKQRYPAELKKWCEHVQERAAMNTIMFMEINPDRPHPNVGPYTPPAVARTACQPDKKP